MRVPEPGGAPLCRLCPGSVAGLSVPGPAVLLMNRLVVLARTTAQRRRRSGLGPTEDAMSTTQVTLTSRCAVAVLAGCLLAAGSSRSPPRWPPAAAAPGYTRPQGNCAGWPITPAASCCPTGACAAPPNTPVARLRDGSAPTSRPVPSDQACARTSETMFATSDRTVAARRGRTWIALRGWGGWMRWAPPVAG